MGFTGREEAVSEQVEQKVQNAAAFRGYDSAGGAPGGWFYLHDPARCGRAEEAERQCGAETTLEAAIAGIDMTLW